jgi:hypothetical protein
MKSLNFAIVLLSIVAIGLSWSASARQWNATPEAKAQEYLKIIDQRPNNEIVLVVWLAPAMIKNSAATKQLREVLEDYFLFGVTHVKVDNVGQFTFKNVSSPRLKPFNGESEAPIDTQQLPPAISGMVTTIQKTFQKLLGPLGKGVKWYIFDGKQLQSCGEGGFWIPYANTNYEFRTPVPGCP